ncbi:N-acetylmuramoyl-L-alanine amidase [Pontibacter vulgaris]|uniref:N-acetylmuramoyl-L-alanine amidase n=1 Tax=Pontibacter vulgaris TaxID=2905679 RepID=UPI001FA73937|nr:N-acetylmuramoyl-L-alanine amidase [Pontibacter vulgaris]
MKFLPTQVAFFLLASIVLASCAVNPYAATNRSYKKQLKAYTRTLRATPLGNAEGLAYKQGDYWVGATNFDMRKPNYVIIHHTAQNSTEQTLNTFTKPATKVSAHYVIGRDGKVYQMLNDYLRAWHGGISKWGNATDLNSSSIGIELDNNGSEPFSEAQMTSLIGVLGTLKTKYNIPTANFIGHSDIAPVRKVDPSPVFPWKLLADNGFGLWYDADVLQDTIILAQVPVIDTTKAKEPSLVFESVPVHGDVPDNFNPQEALRIIGYDTRDLSAAIRSFKLHFIQNDTTPVLTETDKRILFNLYKKYL